MGTPHVLPSAQKQAIGAFNWVFKATANVRLVWNDFVGSFVSRSTGWLAHGFDDTCARSMLASPAAQKCHALQRLLYAQMDFANIPLDP